MIHRLYLLLLLLPSLSLAQPLHRPINRGWQLREVGTDISYPATVPGVVQQDLIRLGIIPNPYQGTNEDSVQWIEDRDWEYRTAFFPPTPLTYQHYTLVFEGLDTYATVWLNDELILETDNMFRRYEVDVKDLLRAKNSLVIRFRSPIQEHADTLEDLPYHLTAGNDAREDARVSVYTRKAPFQFGWDWGPRIVTTGIWQPITLLGWNQVKLEGYQVHTQAATEAGSRGTFRARFAGTIPAGAELRWVHGDSLWLRQPISEPAQGELTVPFDWPGVKRWWPHTLGEPTLHTLRLEVWQDSTLLDAHTQSVGFRTIDLIQEPDTIGTSFYFLVNSQPFYAIGANVVPPDPRVPLAEPEIWQDLVGDARAVGMNMLRVWGGGIYGPQSFYQTCDSLGILVWQDFMFACSMYPATPNFLASVQEEATQQVIRLQKHPSLALWCGNNEVDVAWHNWGWQNQHKIHGPDSVNMAQAYQAIFHDMLAKTVAQHAPGRPYVHTSPLSNWGKLGNFDHHSMHYWGVWHGRDDFESFYKYVPRFMSEYGFQSFPEPNTVAQFAQPEQWDLADPVMQHHQKSYIGNGEITRHLRKYYPKARDFEDFLYKSQLTQALAMEMAISAHRQRAGHNMGTLYWQLNDTWPGPSWASRDYYGRWKAAHYGLRNLYAPVAAGGRIAQRQGAVWLHNTTAQPQTVRLVVTRYGLAGTSTPELDSTFTLAAFEALTLSNAWNVARGDQKKSVWEVALWQDSQRLTQDLVYALAPHKLKIPEPQLSLELNWMAHTLTVHSETFVPDVFLQSQTALHWSDNYFSLLPGEEKVIRFEGEIESEADIQWRSWAE